MKHSTIYVGVLLFAGLLVWHVPLYAQERVGKIIVATGSVSASQLHSPSRTLSRGDPIFEDDLIRTGSSGLAQLRFTDGATVTLLESTEFHVDKYEFDPRDAKRDKYQVRLTKGGFRAKTGTIGRRNPKAYQVITPVASIGVKGTFYIIRFMLRGLYLCVDSGGLIVSNSAGTLGLGKGSLFNCAFVPHDGSAPIGLKNRPPELRMGAFNRLPTPRRQELRSVSTQQPIINPKAQIRIPPQRPPGSNNR